MIVCQDCTATKLVPACTDSLTIGQLDFKSTDIFIFIKNTNTNNIQRQDAVTDSDGIATLNLTIPSRDFYNEFHAFEIWVTLRDTTATERLPIWIAGAFFECFEVRFEKIFENPVVSYADGILQLDEVFTEVTPLIDFDGSRGVINEHSLSTVRVWEDQAGLKNAVQGSTALQPTLNGNLLEFDGGDFMVIPDFTYDLNFIHIMALIRNDGCTPLFNQFQDILTQFNGLDTSGQAFAMYIDCATSEIAFDVGGNPINFLSVAGGIPANNFVLAEGIFNKGEHTLDIDGIRKQKQSFEEALVSSIPDVTTDWVIGAQVQGGSFDFFWKGDIACIRTFNSLLSPTQRQREILRMLAKV